MAVQSCPADPGGLARLPTFLCTRNQVPPPPLTLATSTSKFNLLACAARQRLWERPFNFVFAFLP